MVKLTSILIVSLATILGGLAGFFLGKLFDEQISGAIAGALICLPAGIGWVSKKRRFSFVVGLQVFFVFSYYAGGVQGTIFSLASSILTFIFGAVIYRGLFDDNVTDTLGYQARYAIGLLNPPQIIENGKTVFPPNAKSLFGPRLVIIKPQNAAILEQTNRQSRVLGPEVSTLNRFEYVKEIIDLRTRSKTIWISDLLTKENIPIGISLMVVFRIDINDAQRRAAEPFSDENRERIRLINYNWPDWEKNVLAVIEGRTQRLVRSASLETLLSTNNYFKYESIIRNLSNDRSRDWFAQIDRVIIKKIELRSEFAAANVEQWVANTKALTTRITENARAESARDMLATIADGYLRAKDRGMTGAEINREVLRRTLEAISSDPSTKMIFTPELNTLLNSLRGKPLA